MERPASCRTSAARRRSFAVASIGFTLALTCAFAWADPGTPAWEERFDAGSVFSDAVPIQPSSSAVLDQTYFVAGSFTFRGSPGSNADIHVRAYAAGNGVLRWESIWAPSGSDDQAVGLVALDRTIVVAGRTGLNSTGNNAFVVRAFNAADGGTLWQDQCGTSSRPGANSIAALSGRVFVGGDCGPASDGNTGLLRAYATRSGRLLWEVRDADSPLVVAASGKKVFELSGDASGALSLRAYDAARGTALWETQVAVPGTQFFPRLTAGGDAAYVAWETGTSEGTVRGIAAYSARNGAGLWQADPGDRVTALAWAPGRLFAGKSRGDSLLTAYDARNGAVRWQDQPGTVPASLSAEAVTVSGGRLYLAGRSFDSSVEDAANWLVRAYTLQGRLLWQDDQPDTNQLDADATNVVVGAGRVISAGSSGRDTPPFGNLQWVLRAYDATGGNQHPFR